MRIFKLLSIWRLWLEISAIKSKKFSFWYIKLFFKRNTADCTACQNSSGSQFFFWIAQSQYQSKELFLFCVIQDYPSSSSSDYPYDEVSVIKFKKNKLLSVHFDFVFRSVYTQIFFYRIKISYATKNLNLMWYHGKIDHEKSEKILQNGKMFKRQSK